MEENQKHEGIRRTCKTCEYYDYRGLEMSREVSDHPTGYVCTIKGHGTSGDKAACDCYLREGTPMTPKEKQAELLRVARCAQSVIRRKPRSRKYRQEKE